MPIMAAKNMALSPAVADLGLGDQLREQVQDTVAERKKKLLQAAQGSGLPGVGQWGNTGVAMQSSPAAAALLGTIGGVTA